MPPFEYASDEKMMLIRLAQRDQPDRDCAAERVLVNRGVARRTDHGGLEITQGGRVEVALILRGDVGITNALGGSAAKSGLHWVDRGMGGGFEAHAGPLLIAITNQTERHCGWCWHVSMDHLEGELWSRGGCDSADQAKAEAAAWVRAFCNITLAALAVIEPVKP